LTSGNITRCPKGTTTFINTSDSGPGNQSVTYSSGATTFQATVDSTGTSLSFITNVSSFIVYVKGAPGYDTYDYTGTTGYPVYPTDTGLHAPYNSSGTRAGIGHYVVCGHLSTGKASPTLSTTPSAGGTVGSVLLNDTGTLSGGTSPGGTITFSLYDPSHPDCSGVPAYTQTVTVSGNGTYSTTNTTPAGMTGTWSWTATYAGDPANNGAVSTCGQETVLVSMTSPTLTTTPSPGGTVNSVVLNDTGTLPASYLPGGSITFNLYDPAHSDCSGVPAFTQAVTVSGNGPYSTTNTTPAGMTGTWRWTATYTGDSNNKGAVSTCGQETVTVLVAQGSCAGSQSPSTLVSGTNVTSYIPKGHWGTATTGIDVVNVEGTTITNTVIPTANAVNSCASNSVTGQTVCTTNGTDVYILKGTSVTNVLSDGGSGVICFSGGCTTTIGVSMDATSNKALLGISLGGVGGLQFLDLATDTFEVPFASRSTMISEAPLIDPVRHLIVSASENNNVELVDVATSTSPQFFEHPVLPNGELDSSAEDCSTGIILAPAEFSSPSQVHLADISSAVFNPGSGSPGTWAAPEQVQSLTGSNLNAGANGAAVAQGTSTGVIAGEFGGDGLTSIALPATSGTGAVPAIGDWITCETGPDPSGTPFSMGFDPHTLAAYQSPNGGHAIALLVNAGATELVRVDLTEMLNLPRDATGHVCPGGTVPASAERFISLP